MKHDFSMVFKKAFLSIEDFLDVKRSLKHINRMLSEAGHNYTIESYCINYCSGDITLTGSIIGSNSVDIEHTYKTLEGFIGLSIYDVGFKINNNITISK